MVTRPEMAGAIFIPLTGPLDSHQDAALLNGLFARFDIRGIHVHHSTWLYERLPWIRTRFPWVHIADSLHILEWRTGGFVEIAVRVTDAIDVHHVISPQLRDYLIQDMRIPREKVALATLADLTPTMRTPAVEPYRTHGGTPPRRSPSWAGSPSRSGPTSSCGSPRDCGATCRSARFVLHGDGELADEIRTLSRRLGLGDVLEMRGVDQPVSATLDEADVLVITSDNEGVTLTSFEAARTTRWSSAPTSGRSAPWSSTTCSAPATRCPSSPRLAGG